MGGVPRRFPKLNFAFLEGGVGWACLLYSGFLGHWEKRNGRAIRGLDPARLDRAKLGERVPTLEALQKALDIAPADPEVLFRAALVHNQLGETSATLDWLEKAEAAGYSTAKVMDSPDFNALKSNARFQELFSRKTSH